jgi:hypothetical protein
MSAIITGLIGSLMAAALTAFVAGRVGKSAEYGQLRFGLFMWGLAVAFLVVAFLLVIHTMYFGYGRDFWAKAALFIGLGGGAIYSFGEAALVHGAFDDDGIEFHTPWTGAKRERWQDLISVELNNWGSWYTLTFKSGKKIRLSRYLNGHLTALETADSQCKF